MIYISVVLNISSMKCSLNSITLSPYIYIYVLCALKPMLHLLYYNVDKRAHSSEQGDNKNEICFYLA